MCEAINAYTEEVTVEHTLHDTGVIQSDVEIQLETGTVWIGVYTLSVAQGESKLTEGLRELGYTGNIY